MSAWISDQALLAQQVFSIEVITMRNGEVEGQEGAALSAAQVIIQGLTLAAGAVVAISGTCAAIGLAFLQGYLTTIGAPWARDLVSITSLIQFGAPFAAVIGSTTLTALLVHGRGGRLPGVRPTLLVWLLWFVAAVGVARYVDWPTSNFMLLIGSGVAIGVLAPSLLINLVNPWKGHRLAVLATLVYIPALVALPPVLMGAAKGLSERAAPEVLSRVSLSEAGDEDWRLVLVLGEKLLLTREINGKAFRSYKLVSPEEVALIGASRAGAPWAPES